MKPSPHTHHLKAALLALLFVSAWLSKSAHGFFLHHHEEEHLVCHAEYEKGPHLHDERYAVETCSWCDFALSVPDALPALPAFSLIETPAFAASEPVFYSKPCVSSGFDLTLRRGPPVVLQ